MTLSRLGLWAIPGCIALGALLLMGGCSGCSGQKPEPAAPVEGVEEAAEVEVEEVVEVRELGPEEDPVDELDADRRAFIRNHESILRILGEPPHLTLESDQETPLFHVTVYLAQTQERAIRVRMNWELTDTGLKVLRFDVQHREDGGFQREWTPDG